MDVSFEQNKMATDTSTVSATFNVERWLRGIGFSFYTTDFTDHGYVTYERCINLSEDDLRAVENSRNSDSRNVRLFMNRVKELRKLSENDAVKLLWVSTRNYCTVCIK